MILPDMQAGTTGEILKFPGSAAGGNAPATEWQHKNPSKKQ
jgi:hypothetical protein